MNNYTNSSIVLLKNLLCSEHHYQQGLDLISFHARWGGTASGLPLSSAACSGGLLSRTRSSSPGSEARACIHSSFTSVLFITLIRNGAIKSNSQIYCCHGRIRWRSPQIRTPFLVTLHVLSQQKSSKNTLKRAFFELFADTGPKERGPDLGASLIRVAPAAAGWPRPGAAA